MIVMVVVLLMMEETKGIENEKMIKQHFLITFCC